ncbi:MAG: LPXTG cell wall anchor domain-containing protein, partial [Thermoplasmata archaeon]|nr:LPXTG cell wall anchor domain-containing protein [Thermoplasmata archaeon]
DVYVADYSYHNVTVIHGAAINGSIQVGSEPTSFAYDPQNNTIFVANYGSGNISVINASTDQIAGSFSGYFPEYLAYDAANNALYVASSENGQVSAYNATSYASLGAPVDIQSSGSSGGIAYGASSGDIYVSNTYDSSVSVFSNVATGPNTTYPVTFIESGLTGGTTWAVTLGSNSSLSNLTDIAFAEPNGSYAFTVASVPGYVRNVSSGDVTVAGAATTKYIGFTAVSGGSDYPLQFNESGLPQGTVWGLTATPVGATGPPTASAPSPVALSAPNGSYEYTVHAVSGFSSSAGTGSVVIAGAPRYVTIVFARTPTPLTASLATDPSTLSLGGSTTLTTTPAGGTPAYSYAYSGLPAGCGTANAATLHCTPTATGNFSITVNVTDTAGGSALAHATLRVSASVGTASATGSSSLEWWIIAGLLILFALIVLLVVWRRRRKPEPALPAPP